MSVALSFECRQVESGQSASSRRRSGLLLQEGKGVTLGDGAEDGGDLESGGRRSELLVGRDEGRHGGRARYGAATGALRKGQSAVPGQRERGGREPDGF